MLPLSFSVFNSNQADNDEIEIDIDILQIPTLRKLQAYVKQTLEEVARQQNEVSEGAQDEAQMEAMHQQVTKAVNSDDQIQYSDSDDDEDDQNPIHAGNTSTTTSLSHEKVNGQNAMATQILDMEAQEVLITFS